MFDGNFTLRRARRPGIQKKTTLSHEVREVLKILSITLISIMLVSSFFFLFSMSKTAQQGYSLRQNEIINRQLLEKNRLLYEQVLKSQSFRELLQSDAISEMEKIEKPIYVLPATDRLTQRK